MVNNYNNMYVFIYKVYRIYFYENKTNKKMNTSHIKESISFKLPKTGYLSADFETTKIEVTEKQEFIVGGVTDGDNFYYVKKIKDFINLLNRFEQKIIYFHNLAYDFRFFIEHYNKNLQYQYKIIFAQSRVIKMEIKDINSKLLYEFRDSYALFPMSLEAVNKAYNKIYFKDTKYKLEEKLTKNMIKYLKLDCLSLYESIYNFGLDHKEVLKLLDKQKIIINEKFKNE